MKEIVLPQGHYTIVDDDDFEWAIQLPLRCLSGRGKSYVWFYEDSRTVFLHRCIIGCIDDTVVVDHRNGDSLDNRRSNLRVATLSQNAANRPPRSACGFKGVRWSSTRQCWEAAVRKGNKVYRKTGLSTITAAAAAYDELALKHHGEFAWLNLDRYHTPESKIIDIRNML